MNNESFQTSQNKISFRKLTTETKNKLLFMQQDEENNFVFSEKLSYVYWLAIVGSLVWIYYIFSASQGNLWENWMFWIITAVTLLASVAFVFSLTKIVSSFVTRIKNGYVVTPDEIIKIKGDCVQIWNLREVEALRIKEEEELEVWMGTREERIKFSNREDARRLEKIFDSWKLEAKDGFALDCANHKFAYNSLGKIALAVILVGISASIGVGLAFAAKTANVNYDDDLTWTRVSEIESVTELENYKSRHPFGKHISEADQKISELLNKIKNDYAAGANKKADPSAAAALSALLDEITKSANRTVFIKISEARELDEEVIKQMEVQNGFNINSYEYTAPVGGEEFRKQKLLNDVQLAFKEIAKNGAVKFELTENLPENKLSIEINYLVRSIGMYYESFSWLGGSRSVNYNPGVEYTFNFALKSDAASKNYQTVFSGLPASLDSGIHYEKDAVNYSFDKMYFTSVSEDFGRYLEEKFGFAK